MAALRILAIAAASGRVGYVYLTDRRLRDWGISEKAAGGTVEAAALAQSWINRLRPEVVATEKLTADTRKGAHSQRLIAAIAETAAHNYLLDVEVRRLRTFPSKYEEAAALAQRYPELAAWLPRKRRFFHSEPRSVVLFEALALGEAVLDGPPTDLAAAMG